MCPNCPKVQRRELMTLPKEVRKCFGGGGTFELGFDG